MIKKFKHLVTNTMLDEYNELFGDTNSIHNEEKLHVSIFPKPVINGAYLISLANAHIGKTFNDGVLIHSQSIKYFHPIHVGDNFEIILSYDENREKIVKIEISGMLKGETMFSSETVIILYG